ncbi:hypothetical protein [Geodermatophilus sp. FMUSA9-8]|uniref:hypothetical protein n=1 Tax=Geodermatophilus sp. FMUSA9-8 TaxID=3120155 RepID=UPI003008E676
MALGQEVKYLVRPGWSEAHIEQRLRDLAPAEDDPDAALVTVDQVVAADPYATCSHRRRTTVRIVDDAHGRPRVDGVGRVLVQHDAFKDRQWLAPPRELGVPDPG